MNHLEQFMRTKLTIHCTNFCSTRSCLSYWVENHPTNPVNTRIRTTWFWSIHLLILAEWICRTRDSDPIVSTCWWYIRSCQRHTIQDIAWYTEWHWRCVCWNKVLAVFSEKLRAKIKSEFMLVISDFDYWNTPVSMHGIYCTPQKFLSVRMQMV